MRKRFLMVGMLIGFASMAEAQNNILAVQLSVSAKGDVKLVRLYADKGVASSLETANKTSPAFFTASILDGSGHPFTTHEFMADVSGTIVDNFAWGKEQPSPFPDQILINIYFPLATQSGTLVVEHQGKHVLEEHFNLAVSAKPHFSLNPFYLSTFALRNPGMAIGSVCALIICAIFIFKLFKRKQKKGFLIYLLMFLNILFVLFLFFILAFLAYIKLRLG